MYRYTTIKFNNIKTKIQLIYVYLSNIIFRWILVMPPYYIYDILIIREVILFFFNLQKPLNVKKKKINLFHTFYCVWDTEIFFLKVFTLYVIYVANGTDWNLFFGDNSLYMHICAFVWIKLFQILYKTLSLHSHILQKFKGQRSKIFFQTGNV